MFLQPNPPLVSLVCPTYNRVRYMPIVLRCFSQQTYPSLELIIVDDGTELLTLPADGRIHHITLADRTPTGTKRNIGANHAKGDIVANLDDDDWSSPHRIEDEVLRLMKTAKPLTAYNASILYNNTTKNLYKLPHE